MNERIPLIADKGYIYTNGKGVFGSLTWVADGINAEDFYQITLAEYEEILATQNDMGEEITGDEFLSMVQEVL